LLSVIFAIDPSGVFDAMPAGLRFMSFINSGAILLIEAFADAYALTKVNYEILRVGVPQFLVYSLWFASIGYFLGGNLVFIVALIQNQEPLWGLPAIFMLAGVVLMLVTYLIAVDNLVHHIADAQKLGMAPSQNMERAVKVLKDLRMGWIGIGLGTMGFTAWCAYTLTDNDSWVLNPERFDGRYTFIMSNSATNLLFRLWFIFRSGRGQSGSVGDSQSLASGKAKKASTGSGHLKPNPARSPKSSDPVSGHGTSFSAPPSPRAATHLEAQLDESSNVVTSAPALLPLPDS